MTKDELGEGDSESDGYEVGGKKAFEVERVVGKQKMGGHVQYRVKWKHCGEEATLGSRAVGSRGLGRPYQTSMQGIRRNKNVFNTGEYRPCILATHDRIRDVWIGSSPIIYTANYSTEHSTVL